MLEEERLFLVEQGSEKEDGGRDKNSYRGNVVYGGCRKHRTLIRERVVGHRVQPATI